jgi:hypothetical protein
VSLSACGKNSDDSDTLTVESSGIDTGRPEDRFGKGFGEKFRADPNSEPANVTDGELAPVSDTTEPIPIN